MVSLVQVVLTKRGMNVVKNNQNKLISIETITDWRVCMDYRKLNVTTRKDLSFTFHWSNDIKTC